MTIKSRLVPQCAHDMYQKYKWYMRHPWARIFVACFLAFLNFLMLAEDPVAHSKAEALIPVVGHAYAMIGTSYPSETGLAVIKFLTWILAIFIGMSFGRIVIHHRLLRDRWNISMFGGGSSRSKPECSCMGSWMVMFWSTIIILAMSSALYNCVLYIANPDDLDDYLIDGGMNMMNETFMKAAAVGTWMGDSITAFMVLDMVLQDDSKYPEWHPSWRKQWKEGNGGMFRVGFFWVGMITFSTLVIWCITADTIDWDDNAGSMSVEPSTEVGRAYLAGFITCLDLMVVIQDWDFPAFEGDQELKLPGLPFDSINFNIPAWAHLEFKIFDPIMGTKNRGNIFISGKWFNYGIIFMVMCLDMNMLKNQVIYHPDDYGQCVDFGMGPNGYTDQIFSPAEVWFIESDLFVPGLDCSNSTATEVYFPEDRLTIEGQMLRTRFIGASIAEFLWALAPVLTFMWLFVKAAKAHGNEHEGMNGGTTQELVDTESPLKLEDVYDDK